MSEQKTVVNSWNEWDPLKHVIVGRATGTMVQAPEPNVYRDWPEHGFPGGTYGPLPREMEDKANEQLDDFAEMLEKRRIRVDRPTPLDFSQRVQTPDWVQETMFGCMPPRDVLVCSDVLDVAYNPGGAVDLNGLTSFELSLILHQLACAGIDGFDIVEISPLSDLNDVSSHTAVWMSLYVMSGIVKDKFNLK